MTDNIPPEIAADLLDRAECVVTSAEWLPESVVCSLGAMCDLRSSVQRAIAASNDAASAPAPVRISPEVRETILQALDELKDKYHEVEIDDAIAFVEALP